MPETSRCPGSLAGLANPALLSHDDRRSLALRVGPILATANRSTWREAGLQRAGVMHRPLVGVGVRVAIEPLRGTGFDQCRPGRKGY